MKKPHNIFIFFILLMIANVVWFLIIKKLPPKSTVPAIPKIIQFEPGSIKPAPALPPIPPTEISTQFINKFPKLVPPRKDLPPAPPIPDMKNIMGMPSTNQPKLVPPRKDLPPAPPLPPRMAF